MLSVRGCVCAYVCVSLNCGTTVVDITGGNGHPLSPNLFLLCCSKQTEKRKPLRKIRDKVFICMCVCVCACVCVWVHVVTPSPVRLPYMSSWMCVCVCEVGHDVTPFTGTLLASLHSQKEGCGFKTLHSGTHFQTFVVSGAPAHRCHVKGRPNHNKSVLFDAKTCTV